MPFTLYDRTGAAIAYSDDERHVFLFDGQPIAYLDEGALYSYPGELLGWFDAGWLRDKDGRCVAFAEQSVGGPRHPAKEAEPPASDKQAQPPELRRDQRTLQPIHSNGWSTQSAMEFFHQKPVSWPGTLGDGHLDRRSGTRRLRKRREHGGHSNPDKGR